MARKPATRKPPVEKVVELPQRERAPAPLTLEQVFGQERAKSLIVDALRADRVHHAWVFEGPVGVGKCSLALAFAALLLDPTTRLSAKGEAQADPDSVVQRLLRGGGHPDLSIITRELGRLHDEPEVRRRKHTTLSVDVVRQFVLAPGSLAPAVSPGGAAGKVFIIDEAELMTTQAQNALLKFLEEPPQRTVLMLVCNNPEELLPTIRSRCQRVVCEPLPRRAMESWMTKWGGVPTGVDREWLLSFAEGSPGVVTRAIEMGIPAWRAKLDPMLERSETGAHVVELGPTMYDLADGWARAWVKQNEEQRSKEAANHVAASWMMRLVAHRARQRLRADASRLGPLTHGALAVCDAVLTAEREVEANVNMLFVLDKLGAEISAAYRGEAPL